MNYAKIYNELMIRSKSRLIEGYVERHHIIPLCMEGLNTDENIAILTAREHFIAHLLLTKIFRNNYKLSSAFNKMFSISDNQVRYLPKSYWYEYRRKNFSENHPTKSPEVRKKISDTLIFKNNIGKFCTFSTCEECAKIIYNSSNRRYCSNDCLKLIKQKKFKLKAEIKISKELAERGKECLECDKLHLNKYCCGRECFLKYQKQKDNLHTKKLSEIRSDFIKNNYEQICISNQKAADNADNVKRGQNIAKAKRGKYFNEIDLIIFNNNNNIMFEIKGNFVEFCKNKNLDYDLLANSYRNNGSRIIDVTGKLDNWYCIIRN